LRLQLDCSRISPTFAHKPSNRAEFPIRENTIVLDGQKPAPGPRTKTVYSRLVHGPFAECPHGREKPNHKRRHPSCLGSRQNVRLSSALSPLSRKAPNPTNRSRMGSDLRAHLNDRPIISPNQTRLDLGRRILLQIFRSANQHILWRPSLLEAHGSPSERSTMRLPSGAIERPGGAAVCEQYTVIWCRFTLFFAARGARGYRRNRNRQQKPRSLCSPSHNGTAIFSFLSPPPSSFIDA